MNIRDARCFLVSEEMPLMHRQGELVRAGNVSSGTRTRKITMKVASQGEVVFSFANNKSFIQANVHL